MARNEPLLIANVLLLHLVEVIMFKLSNIPFVGLGFLFVGLAGFVVMAVVLGNHPDLFAIIIGWYAIMIAGAGLALTGGLRQARRFRAGHV